MFGDAGNMAFFNDAVYIRKAAGWTPLISSSSISYGNGTTITTTGNGVSVNLSRLLTSLGTGVSIVGNGIPGVGDYSLKSLTSSNGIVITSNVDTISMTNSRRIVNASNAIVTNSASLISQGLPSLDYSLKKIAVSDGLSLTDLGGIVTITPTPDEIFFGGLANLRAVQFPSGTTLIPTSGQAAYTFKKFGKTVHLELKSSDITFIDPSVGKYAIYFTINGLPDSFMPGESSASYVKFTGFQSTSFGLEINTLYGIAGSICIANDSPGSAYMDMLLMTFFPPPYSPTNTVTIYIGMGTLYNNTGTRNGAWDGAYNSPAGITWTVD